MGSMKEYTWVLILRWEAWTAPRTAWGNLLWLKPPASEAPASLSLCLCSSRHSVAAGSRRSSNAEFVLVAEIVVVVCMRLHEPGSVAQRSRVRAKSICLVTGMGRFVLRLP